MFSWNLASSSSNSVSFFGLFSLFVFAVHFFSRNQVGNRITNSPLTRLVHMIFLFCFVSLSFLFSWCSNLMGNVVNTITPITRTHAGVVVAAAAAAAELPRDPTDPRARQAKEIRSHRARPTSLSHKHACTHNNNNNNNAEKIEIYIEIKTLQRARETLCCYAGLRELLAGWSLLRFDCVRVMHNTSSPKTYTAHNWKLLLLSWRRLD